MSSDVASVVRHAMSGRSRRDIRIQVSTGRIGPVRSWGREDGPRGGGDAPVGPHREVEFGTVVVTGHEEVRLILVGGGIGGGGLGGLGQSLEVELVRVALAVHFGHDVLVVVVSQGPAQLVVVHVGFTLAFAPAPGHFVRVGQLEFAVGSLPRDAVGVATVRQQLQQKLPQLDLTTA